MWPAPRRCCSARIPRSPPTLTTHELKHYINASVDVKGLPTITGGRLNLHEALTLPASPVTVELTAVGPTSIAPGDPVSIDLRFENTSGDSHDVEASLRVWTLSGDEPFLAGPVNATLTAGQVIMANITLNTPGSTPVGDYRFIGRVENAATGLFDEDQVIYDIQ